MPIIPKGQQVEQKPESDLASLRLPPISSSLRVTFLRLSRLAKNLTLLLNPVRQTIVLADQLSEIVNGLKSHGHRSDRYRAQIAATAPLLIEALRDLERKTRNPEQERTDSELTTACSVVKWKTSNVKNMVGGFSLQEVEPGTEEAWQSVADLMSELDEAAAKVRAGNLLEAREMLNKGGEFATCLSEAIKAVKEL